MKYINVLIAFSAIVMSGCQLEDEVPSPMPVEITAQYMADNMRYIDASNLLPVACPTENVGVFSTAGQSNSSNIVYDQFDLHNTIYMFFDGYCYEATGPLLGSTGFGEDFDLASAIWLPLADRLIDEGYYDNIILTASGVGGSSIEEWQVGGTMYSFYIDQQYKLKEAGYTTTAILFQQGESDTTYNTGYDVYRENLTNLVSSIRADGIDAPFFVAQSTYCLGYNENSVPIRMAQADTAEETQDIYLGADTDWIRGVYRSDDCHFNHDGAIIAADLWFDAVTPVLNTLVASATN